jgi:hypothetical protein
MVATGNVSDTAALNKLQSFASVLTERMNERPNMKKMIASLLAVALMGALAPKARAHDNGWAVAGAVLAGVTAGAVIASAASGGPVYVAPPPVVYAPPARPVVYAPAPVVVAPAPMIWAPRPAVVYAPPVYVRPAPVMVVRHGWGYHGPRRGYGHGHW